MKILVFALGSSGDVHPMMGLGQVLARRGHYVTIITNGYFRQLVERVGLEFLEEGREDDFRQLISNPDLWHSRRGFFYIARHAMLGRMRDQYELVAKHAVPGQTVMISSCLSFGARIARDKLGIPLITVHLQPSAMWSVHDSPKLPPLWTSAWLPSWVKNLQFRIGEKFLLDPFFCPEINAFRAELDLPPIRHVTSRWWHSPDGVLGMFPDWYAPIQPDWPCDTRLVGFPLWDERGVTEVPDQLGRFLHDVEPPFVFTPGSAMIQGQDFFATAVRACRLLGRKGILLTRFPDQIPRDLPASVRHFDYIPFSVVLPRAAALVHHGGIGTTAQALAAGIPQLIMPMTFDQPDNAVRLRRLGVGEWLSPHSFRPAAVAKKLQLVTGSSDVRECCHTIAARISRTDSLSAACDEVERVASRHGVLTETCHQRRT